VSAKDPLNLIQVMLAQGMPLFPSPAFSNRALLRKLI